jgi:IS30 family transposase
VDDDFFISCFFCIIIEKLPSSSRFDNILVIVDRLSKQSIFIPTFDTISTPILAKLFVLHVFSKHGVPSHVTSDQGTEFMSSFFHSLGKALDMKLHFTSGYHPEGDGQTERMNQTLRTISPCLLQLSAGQLVGPPPLSRIFI